MGPQCLDLDGTVNTLVPIQLLEFENWSLRINVAELYWHLFASLLARKHYIGASELR